MRKSKLITDPIKHNYVYLIREREFIRTNDEIYKLGKTTQTPNSRLQGYPKESEVLLYIDVNDCHAMEKELISEFDERYKHRDDIGREYYEGDLNDMKRTFFGVIGKTFNGPYVPLAGGKLKWLWGLIKRIFV